MSSRPGEPLLHQNRSLDGCYSKNTSTVARLALAEYLSRNRCPPLVHCPGWLNLEPIMDGRACPRPEGAFSFAAQPRCPEGQDRTKNTKTFGGHQDISHRVILCPFHCLLRLAVPRKWSGSLVPVSFPPFLQLKSERALDLHLTCCSPDSFTLTSQLSHSHTNRDPAVFLFYFTLTFTSHLLSTGKPAPSITTPLTTEYELDRYLCGNTTPFTIFGGAGHEHSLSINEIYNFLFSYRLFGLLAPPSFTTHALV
ncbi:hypothetical protein LX32DRAFT_151915 [Colletotrichum zoysiae]|uniref:Uncharacterized protein n=1 Tax=Colletotrichum zoysiae TaxID=1216348 RepID=A0AAD9M6L2_9PEZI|nr:hypothetical protein LX32DRAFT_151915 [Colletotrichum zoysiae]